MKLEFIQGDNCPVCFSNVVIEESVEVDRYGKNPTVREHTCGGKWEKRLFICGQALEYSPNFRRTEVSTMYVCQNNPELIEKLKKKETARQSVLSFIDQLTDVDEEFKKRLHSEVRTIYMG